MSAYLLDTNILSNLMRDPRGKIVEHIQEVGEDSIATSVVVAAELRFGAAKKGSPLLTERVEAVLGVMAVLPFEPPADAHYALLRADLERRGEPIGANDMLIAAHALSLGRVLVTDNVREFGRVAGLPVVNWLA